MRIKPRRPVGAAVLATATMLVLTPSGGPLNAVATATTAATPGPVSARVEGAASTLIPTTQVTTKSTTFTHDGNAAHSCSGSSAAQALELATAGNWSGTWYDSFSDWLVSSIAGETPNAANGFYWSFWLDHKPASLGICSQPVNPSDEILFFPDCYGAGCGSGWVSPAVLGLTAPSVASQGSPFTVTVTSYANADGTSSPAANATVTGPGVNAPTTANGTATVSFSSSGSFALRATAPQSVRSETRTVCVHNGNDGNCGTTAPPAGTPGTGAGVVPAPPPAPCVHHGNDGLCGTPDMTPPAGHITQIAEQHHFAHGHGPRHLQADVGPEPGGLRDIQARLERRNGRGGHSCEGYDGRSERFRAIRCGIANAPWFSLGNRAPVDYLLPFALGPDRYVLDVEAIDVAGNRDSALARGRNRIAFYVD